MKTTTLNLLKDITQYKIIPLSTLLEQPEYKRVRSTVHQMLMTLEELAYITTMPTEDGAGTLVACTEAGLSAMRLYNKHKAHSVVSQDIHQDAAIAEVLLKLAHMPNVRALRTVQELLSHERGKYLPCCDLEATAALDEGIPHRRLWVFSLRYRCTFEQYSGAEKSLEALLNELPPTDSVALIVPHPELETSLLQTRSRLPSHMRDRFIITDKNGADLQAAQEPKISPFELKNTAIHDLKMFADESREAYE